MRAIDRGDAPVELTTLLNVEPARKWSTNGEPDVHRAIADTLRQDQSRLCAYCEQPLEGVSQVEHIHPKSVVECATRKSHNFNYDWQNLLLVCGAKGHCDGPKADRDLCGSVLFPDEMDGDMTYWDINSLDGELQVAAGLPSNISEAAQRAIDELNLNDAALKKLRVVVMELIQQKLDEYGDEGLARHRVTYAGFATTADLYFV